ncbi:hypothetical protein BCT01_00990 [Vibrio tasmaniensis]|uniref:hypothetical protein n=1 Tax=Vibrio TaxID=662 RepID=UPI000C821A52|nr:hypothetical protein [Vibrio tasmaniensis]PMO89889.1 hypothetical protein BCT01_00990 [Vibrio tasmaniensis]
METTIEKLNQLLLQSHAVIDKTTEGGISVGVVQYVPEINAAVGYLQNNRNMKIVISVKPQSPTVHLVIGHKSGEEIIVEKEYPSLESVTETVLTDLCTTHLMNS